MYIMCVCVCMWACLWVCVCGVTMSYPVPSTLRIEMIQRVYRGSKVLSWYRNYKKAAVRIETCIRMLLARNRFITFKRCVLALQCALRRKISRKKLSYKRWLKKIIIIQATIRKHKWRVHFLRIRKAATTIGGQCWSCIAHQTRNFIFSFSLFLKELGYGLVNRSSITKIWKNVMLSRIYLRVS